MLSSLIELLRDVAVIAAIVGGALAFRRWQPMFAAKREAGERLAIEQAGENRAAATRIEAALGAIARDLGALAAAQRENEARSAIALRIHALLQATTDPFLSFDEIRTALAPTKSDGDAAAGAEPSVAADVLRRVLLDLVRDRVVAQLDRDRYFIASDFDTEDTAEAVA